MDQDARSNGGCRRLRLTQQVQEQSDHTSQQQHRIKGDSVALPQQSHRPTINLISPTEEKVEVIKFYLESRHKQKDHNQQSTKMLTDEVSQIQEVRYCLKTLREQMAARQNHNVNKNKYPVNGYRETVPTRNQVFTNGNSNGVGTESEPHARDTQEESVRLREATKRLYSQLKESEKKQQEERDRLQAESGELRRRLDEQSTRLQKAEGLSEERGQRVEELQNLLGGMEIESAILKDKMATGEAELQQLRGENEKEGRCEKLEKELAILKEKIHHLDDMLKSQQRKVRHMIEQLQNSRTVIQERDRFIQDLEEKMAFLEAENREMHDHMEYFLGGENPVTLTTSENKPQIIYSKEIIPSTHSNKSLPFIKVIEIKS